ncbi:Peptidase M, neutral zinc metallopeptidase, zinc-binding site [Prochlorococcus marinus str. MIT 9312]|uniref:Aminopeptidase N n=1 Tax=Prochlorococcus marinus (strain MIT 9312) TaxID=74546 RepID=Q31AM4_PROM9|nr:aminopeptidase N [Prochlorococcus marinus]ABB50071.1 Peptidase M, neutral zinc metallopeptidase, zinc-binding site [Prochlorococcus marinus str. MIT 9312]KGF98916.1 Membrane alanine aminopeptidase N [Prochlorococcus marinus str. MIT 9311]
MNKPISEKKISRYVKLEDYKVFDYEIPEIFLDFVIKKNSVNVKTTLRLVKNNKNTKNLILDGIDILIKKIYIDDSLLEEKNYKQQKNNLEIKNINKDSFSLKIEGIIKPKENTSLLGMYESNGIITTQCEAEGFRRISYHSDRPDILSKYTVRIEADKNDYPILLSNGNVVKENKLTNNRHEIIWEDPYPKPSYLFALVAGKLNCVRDYFITKSNKKVKINIYVEDGDEKYVQHAISSLKKSMKWDEDKYNLEYDLSLFNIVAVRHFNMGAMENKSLNIFNSKLILADSETTTDEELERIEGVIAHEYFHNWTGNRVTCRDWFQLSLKEGLTVFRDQQFTADLHNHEIKRLEDAKFLRRNQFREDSGPTSHPVMPEKYQEIDNFYTTTIYEKGSEIIRMLNNLVKEKNFYKGFSNYISTYDGKAATIEQFVDKILENNKEIDPEEFIVWYKQNGTPKVNFKRIWDQTDKKLTIQASQSNPIKNNPNNDLPLIIPINLAIFCDENKTIKKTVVLKSKKQEFIFRNVRSQFPIPLVTYFREFSSPVEWGSDTTLDEEFLILKYEKDYFIISNTVKVFYKNIIACRLNDKPDFKIENKLISTLISFINNRDINLSLLSELLSIPTFAEIESEMINIDPLKIYKTIDELNYLFGTRLKKELYFKLQEIEKNLDKVWPEGKHERKLIETIWKLLLHSNDEEIKNKIINYVDGTSMTLAKAALNSFSRIDCPERKIISKIFFNKWNNNCLVLDSWFAFNASIEINGKTSSIEKLFENKFFDSKSPNTLRAILNTFVTRNSIFHAMDGSGYKYIAKKITHFDKLNPIVISRFVKVFSRYNYYSEPYKSNMIETIKQIKRNKLSTNTKEVLDAIIE